MAPSLILASSSDIRQRLLRNAGFDFQAMSARLDETAILSALQAEHVPARDISDALAEAKAMKISQKWPDALVIGSDQILELDGAILQKATSPDDLADQLERLQGRSHVLWSAAVICQGAQPQWRHVGRARMTMHAQTRVAIESYVTAHWDDIRHCVGGYRFEAEGLRLFSQVEGDYFNILGIPLLELVNYLTIRGVSS